MTVAETLGIDPNKRYDTPETMELVGLKERKSLYAIPGDELPRYRVGAGRGKFVYIGADIIRYLEAGKDGDAP